MKQAVRAAVLPVIISLVFLLPVSGQESSVEEGARQPASFTAGQAGSDPVKPAATPVPARDYTKEINELRVRINELSGAVNVLREEARALAEKNMELAGVSNKADRLETRLLELEQKNEADKKRLDSHTVEFREMRDTVKDRVDRMRSWDDILGVLKKEITNNELETARLKKEINDLKRIGGGESVFDAVASWPYIGITALIISIAAFIAAVAR
ncbi:MAG TPA: hypothetical protein ENN43_08060 [bacterium]|nr:hypothetical protein [bacterium]